jgi:cytochrome c-type biogenesis protein CcmH
VNQLTLVLLVLVAAPSLRAAQPSPMPVSAIEAPRSRPLSGAELEERTNDVGGLLRCPVCQGLSVADSPSSMARNMKTQVREKLAAGYDQEQILASFERSYGEFVRLEPPMRGVNWLIWFGPLTVLVAGGGVIAWAVKRSSRGNAGRPEGAGTSSIPSDLPSPDTLPADARLAGAVRRTRELAYGWPGGISPRPRSSP